MAEFFLQFIKSFVYGDIPAVMLLSVIPFVEARGAIPFAFGLGLTPFGAGFYCVTAATLAIPVILLLFAPTTALLKKIKFTNKLVLSLEDVINEKAQSFLKKVGKKAAASNADDMKYKMLFALAAVPLPLTGIWTSSAAAVILKLDKFKAFVSIALGNLCSSAVLIVLMKFFAGSITLILNILIASMIAAAVFTVFKIIFKGKRKVA
ncbi:MAG: small multi-drug export protein [Clostridiales bacterium]|jgi:uncharacterized membrane protein|nr:small multi-drug export protein [Clostridiales bacterium]